MPAAPFHNRSLRALLSTDGLLLLCLSSATDSISRVALKLEWTAWKERRRHFARSLAGAREPGFEPSPYTIGGSKSPQRAAWGLQRGVKPGCTTNFIRGAIEALCLGFWAA